MKMYVSNLEFQTGNDDLRNLFEPFGPVAMAKIITDHTTGNSRGFGFVEMESNQHADEAMQRLNGKLIEGRAISVSVARERESRPAKRIW